LDGNARKSGVPGSTTAAFRVLEIEPAAGVPLVALVAVYRDPGVIEHPGQVKQIPRHECGVAVGEIVVRAAGARVEVRRAGAGFADPAGIGLWRMVYPGWL
jgi:hypothetical protein